MWLFIQMEGACARVHITHAFILDTPTDDAVWSPASFIDPPKSLSVTDVDSSVAGAVLDGAKVFTPLATPSCLVVWGNVSRLNTYDELWRA